MFKKSMLSLAILMTLPGVASAQSSLVLANRMSRLTDLSNQSNAHNNWALPQEEKEAYPDGKKAEKNLAFDASPTSKEDPHLAQEIMLLEALLENTEQAVHEEDKDDWNEWEEWDTESFVAIPKHHRIRSHVQENHRQKVAKMDRRQSKRLAQAQRWA